MNSVHRDRWNCLQTNRNASSTPNWLAQHVLNGIVQRTGTRNNGVRVRPGLYVLRRGRSAFTAARAAKSRAVR